MRTTSRFVTADAATAAVRNSIVWDNVPNGLAGGGIIASWTCHQGPLMGQGNLFTNPLFVNLADGDLRLSEASPCIDAGNTALLSATVSTDLDGLPRAANVREFPSGIAAYGYFIDMGVFEYPEPSTPPTCPGDFNQDGIVDGADLGLLLGSWGPCL